jgi:hypothetical protein
MFIRSRTGWSPWGEVDPVLVLQDDPLAGLEVRRHRPAGVLVPVPHAQVPDLDRFGGRVGQVDEERCPPASFPLRLRGQGLAGRGEIHDPGGPLLELEDFLRLAGERRVQDQIAVTEGDDFLRVALVQGLRPDEGGRLVGHPVDVSRALGDAVDGDILFRRQVGQDLEQSAVHVPDLDRVGEASRRERVGIGLLDPFDQDVIHCRRDGDAVEDPGFSDAANLPCADVDDGGLGGGVIIEEDLVEGVLEQVLVGGNLGFLAAGDLDLGADGNSRRDRGRAAAVGDELDEEPPAVGEPVGPAEDGVDGGRGQGPGRSGRDVDGPELDAVIDITEEGYGPAVGRPGGEGELDTLGQADLPNETGLHVLEAEAGREAQDLAAVERGRDAHAGDPQDGLGDVGDRRHRLAVDEGHDVAGGAHGDHGRRRGVDDVDDLLGRELVGLLGEDGGTDQKSREAKNGQTDG